MLDLRRTADELKPQLQMRIGQLANDLAPGGYVAGGEYIAPNPTRADAHIGSFKIQVNGPKCGSWVDYAGVNAPFRNGGDRGDVFDLIAYVKFDRNRAKAIAWALEWCGRSGIVNTDVRLATARRALALSEDDREKARRARAQRIWRRACHWIKGTVAETYLREARKIPLEEIISHTRDLRFAPDLKHTVSGLSFPALVAAMKDRNGNLTGVHCTYLEPDGSGKAPVDPKKIMHGRAMGSVIRVANGETRLSPEEAAAAGRSGVLALAEGIEDALSLAAAAPWARAWAAGSLGNLGHAPVDHPCVSHVVVAADNDKNPRAIAALERAIEQLREHRKPLGVMRSPIGKDINDAFRGAA